jgi:hypothetical protein
VCEGGWKGVSGLIEVKPEREVGEREWKVINWLIKIHVKHEVSERGWEEVVDWLIE